YAGGRQQVDPRTLEVASDGVDDVWFDPFEVPDDAVVRLVLSARAGADADEGVAEIPIRPWGVQEFATASGTSSDDTAATVALPPGRTYESPEMLVVISPSTQRLLYELALGRDAYALDTRRATCLPPAGTDTTADRASDLLAAAAMLEALRAVRTGEAPEDVGLTGRVRGLVSGLLPTQNQDGGWAWAGAGRDAATSDRGPSARVVWALAIADSLGLLPDPAVLSRATGYLAQVLARSEVADHEARAEVLYALALRGEAG